MKSTIVWKGEGLVFSGKTESGHQVDFDGELHHAASPMEHVLMALGSCSAIDVVLILKKMRQDVRGCRVELDGMRRDEVPRVFTRVEANYVVSGVSLDPAKVEQAIKLSQEKYCSVALMLKPGVEVVHRFELVESES